MEVKEHEKRGRPGLIHHMSDVMWMQGGRENDVRGGDQPQKQHTGSYIQALYHSSDDSRYFTWSKLLAFTSKKLALGVYSLHIWTSASPATSIDVTHVMDETRSSPFFTLFRFRVLCWTQTEEQKMGEAWERG